MVIEGSLEAAHPGRSRAKKKFGRGESQKGEDAGARQGRQVARQCVFPMFCGSGGSNSRLANAAGAEPAGQMRSQQIARRCGMKHIWK